MEKKQINWRKYSYIIVDECQDLTRVQLEIIRKLYIDKEESCIWFLTDVAQSIYMHSWLSKHSFKSIGFNMTGKSNILSKNYRTTKQIAMAAYSLLGKDAALNKSDDFVEPVLVEKNGAKPQYHAFEELETELEFLVNEIKKLLMNEKYDLCDIAIVAKSWNYLEDVSTHLLNHGLDAHLLKGQKSEAYYEEITTKIIATREWTVKELATLGFECLPSSANFVFAKHNSVDAETIFNALKAEGIFVRYFKAPRINEYLRITIGTDEEMGKVVEFLKNYFMEN